MWSAPPRRSGLAVVFTADAASAGICSVSGASVSLVGAGTCIVNANQPGDATHQAAPQVQQSFTVGGGPPVASVQSISFTSTAPAGAVAGGSTYTVVATASSGLAVTFSADASSAGVCTVSGSTVSFVGAGTCVIDANQSGNASYQPAPQAQQSFAVGLATQTIAFTSTPPAGAIAGGAGYTVSAAASSGLAVAFSLSAGSAGVCTIAGTSVSFVGGGTCTINANQPGNGTYQAAPQAQQSFTIAASPPPKSPQTIHFTSSAPAGAVVGGSAYNVTATASSGLAVVFSATAGSAGICSVSGSTVSLVGAGTCTINADQSGNGSFLAAPQVQQSFSIGAAPQSISFTSSPPVSAVVGGSAYTVTATASSGLAVTFSAGRGQRRHLHRVRIDRLVRRGRHLHDQCEPGRQRQLSGGRAGPAVVHRRPRLADDHDHVDAPGESPPAQRSVHDRRDLDLGAPGRLQPRSEQRRHLHPVGRHAHVRPPGAVHHLREPGRRRELAPRAPGPAVVPGLTRLPRLGEPGNSQPSRFLRGRHADFAAVP